MNAMAMAKTEDEAFTDKSELFSLEGELESILTWIPPAQRSVFRARIVALLMLGHSVVESERELNRAAHQARITAALVQWRADRARIRAQFGGGR